MVVDHFANGKLTPSPVAPATGRLSARRQVPAYRRQAAGLSGKINIVKLTPLPPESKRVNQKGLVDLAGLEPATSCMPFR